MEIYSCLNFPIILINLIGKNPPRIVKRSRKKSSNKTKIKWKIEKKNEEKSQIVPIHGK